MRPNKNTPVLLLSEKFAGIIWKIKVHENGVIALETRNTELKRVLFSAFNFFTGKIYFKEKSFEESWNLSLAFAGNMTLILNGYGHDETPESKGVMSLKVEDGSVIWQKFNFSLNQVQNEGIQIYDSRFQPRRYTWVDHISGEAIPAPSREVGSANLLFPEIDYSFIIPTFIQHGDLVGDLAKLDHSGKVFLSFHETYNDCLQQRLVVYQEDRILIDDILISGIQKLQPEAFFIQQNHLFYIRNKEEIIAYLV